MKTKTLYRLQKLTDQAIERNNPEWLIRIFIIKTHINHLITNLKS